MKSAKLVRPGWFEVTDLDVAADRAEAAASKRGAVLTADLDEMLAHRDELGLDGIVIATPNALHAPQAIAALEAGLAVLCQKPLALNADEASSIVESARAAPAGVGRQAGVEAAVIVAR